MAQPAEGTHEWHVIRTHPKQELRADENLRAWGIETLAPRLRAWRKTGRTRAMREVSEAFFPQYIFARLGPAQSSHKVRFARGVQGIVHFGGQLAPVDDELIQLIAQRMGDDGFVTLDVSLRPGDQVRIVDGPMSDLIGLFEHEVPATHRVTILLTAVNFGVRVQVDRHKVVKTPSA